MSPRRAPSAVSQTTKVFIRACWDVSGGLAFSLHCVAMLTAVTLPEKQQVSRVKL